MNVNLGRAALAGIIGAAVMTVIGLHVAPMMGIPPMVYGEPSPGPAPVSEAA